MEAHECLKLKGLSECRKLIDGVNIFAVACDVVCDPMLVLDVDNFVSYNDLKKLVDVYELVNRLGGLESAIRERDFRRHKNILQSYDKELSEAIQLVESVNDSM